MEWYFWVNYSLHLKTNLSFVFFRIIVGFGKSLFLMLHKEDWQNEESRLHSCVQELSRVKASLVTERAQAEEELGKVRAQVRLEEVRHTLWTVATLKPAVLFIKATRSSARSLCSSSTWPAWRRNCGRFVSLGMNRRTTAPIRNKPSLSCMLKWVSKASRWTRSAAG